MTVRNSATQARSNKSLEACALKNPPCQAPTQKLNQGIQLCRSKADTSAIGVVLAHLALDLLHCTTEVLLLPREDLDVSFEGVDAVSWEGTRESGTSLCNTCFFFYCEA